VGLNPKFQGFICSVIDFFCEGIVKFLNKNPQLRYKKRVFDNTPFNKQSYYSKNVSTERQESY
jgi:hypothetical protein